MKVTYTTGGATPIKTAELSLENTGVNRFRASIPVQDSAGNVYARTAEIEAASERTKAGTVRVMLKCTIPYFPQTVNESGVPVIDPAKSPKPYTLHIVHTIPAIMANESLNREFASQVAHVVALASQIIALGTLSGQTKEIGSKVRMYNVPLQAGSPSIDGVKAFLVGQFSMNGTGHIKEVNNVTRDVLAGSFIGRALAGLMPIDINTDKTVAVDTELDETLT